MAKRKNIDTGKFSVRRVNQKWVVIQKTKEGIQYIEWASTQAKANAFADWWELNHG